MLASNLGVEIRDRSAYLIPFGKECQLLIDYRAKIDLAAKAGVTVYPPQLVREADGFEYGWDGELLICRHTPSIVESVNGRLKPVEDRGEVVAGWCAAKNSIGHTVVLVMSLADIERIRRRSRKGCPDKTFAELCHLDISEIPYKQRSPWMTDPERMAEKTLIHQMFNRIPQTEEMGQSQEIDAALDDERAPKPIARGMDQVYLELDPADERPMVDGGGETRQEQREAQQKLAERKLAEIGGRTCGTCNQPGHNARTCPNKSTPSVAVNGVREVKDEDSWMAELGSVAPAIHYSGQYYIPNADRSAWVKCTKEEAEALCA